jgi:hypothetical protein
MIEKHIDMKKFITLLLCCLPFFVCAQTNEKYLEGAITFKDGKVTFSTEMVTPAMTKEQIYETLLNWSKERFQPTEKMNARILFQNPEEGSIAIGGEEYIVFSSSSLALDRTRIYYQLKIFCENGKSNIEMTRIRYWYNEARDGGEKYEAENWIVDEWALNKSKTKLAPICGKFRKNTIDLKDELFKEIQAVLGQKMIDLGLKAAPVTPESHVQVANSQQVLVPTELKDTTPKSEKVIQASDDMETLIAQSVRMTITAGNDEQFEISKECWGGFGELFGKKVAFCLIDTQKTMGNLLMTQSDNYKISFYLSNNNQPAVVINCKKLMVQTIKGEEAQKMSPNCIVGKSYNMYVGEILK